MITRVDLATATKDLEIGLGEKLNTLDVDSIASLQSGVEWSRIPDWRMRDDVEIAKWAGLLDPPIVGKMLLITDPSFYEGGTALCFDASELVALFNYHLEKTHERVFGGGDVILWAEEMRTLWLFHHEGVSTRIALSEAELPNVDEIS